MAAIKRFRGIAGALGGMLAGAVVGAAVQEGMQSTGMLGPTVDSLIAAQEQNFTELSGKLDALRGLSADPEVKQTVTELGNLLRRQDGLSRQAQAELRYLSEQVSTLRDQRLAEAGAAGGADHWLAVGESINVGDRSHVFGIETYYRGAVISKLDGVGQRMTVGDIRQIEAGGKTCSVLYKHATPREDQRVGFDVTCT